MALTKLDPNLLLQGHSLTASVAASALTVALKDRAGNDASATVPLFIDFRSSTLTDGTRVFRRVTGALSVVVSSGSTLGHTSGNPHFIYVYAIDNAGTVELAVSSVLLDEGIRYSTTAEGGAGAADSYGVLYSTTARTNVAIRLLGRLKSTQATAGTWATAIAEITNWSGAILLQTSSLAPVRACSAKILLSAGTPSIASQDGNWLASLTDGGVGAFTLNFVTGIFSVAPIVVATTGSGVFACISSAPTTSAVGIALRGHDNAATDDTFYVIAIGAA